jgi:cell division protein ZapA (FtsZ GTPase activity inhibitor)
LVDEKMNLIATQIHTTDSFRIAVLAALHLAYRCLALERQLHSIEGEIADRSEELVAFLEEACTEKEVPASMYQAAS